MVDAAPRIALAHDWLVGLRGGELVLDRLARPETYATDGFTPTLAALYAMFDDGRPLTPTIDALPKRIARLGRGGIAAGRLRRWLLFAYPALVGELSRMLARDHAREPLDLLVSTSSAAIKGLHPPVGVPHLCYCHAPARYLWSRRAEYGGPGLGGKARAAGLALCGPALRGWDRRTAAHVSRFLANSTHTAGLVRDAFDVEAHVVHPPVRTDVFTVDDTVEREDFWLVVSALEPYKRTELAIEAAEIAGVELRIAGDGSQRALLEQRAARARTPVRMLGRVSDDELIDLYRRARLLVFPQVEDFGIVAVEAQACGCPIVARHAGGALDTVIDGETGACFEGEDPAEVARAAERAPHDAAACRRNAERFAEVRFDDAVRAHVAELLAQR